MASISDLITGIYGAISSGSIFMEALRNLNWSRGYDWYVELDGVPSPFAKGGILGLPVTSLTYNLGSGSSYEWQNGNAKLKVPQGGIDFGSVDLEVMDDEQGTLHMFFERWYNEVYNPYLGVLPVTEACKKITIYRTKSTRKKIERNYTTYSALETELESISSTTSSDGTTTLYASISKTTSNDKGVSFLVYPDSTFQLSYTYNNGEPFTFAVRLSVADFCNQDFTTATTFSGDTEDISFLDKLADYI